jgi:hypothetical protein
VAAFDRSAQKRNNVEPFAALQREKDTSMSVRLSTIELFCRDHVKLSQWYQRTLGMKHQRSSPDVEFLTDGTTRIVFSKGKPDTYKNSTLYFTTNEFETIDRGICENEGIRIQSLAIVEEDETKVLYSALYEDIETNVIGLFVEEWK